MPQNEKEVPRLSYSIAQTMVTKTPLHAWAQHRLLGGAETEDTKAMDEGRLMERFVLGAGLDGVVIVDAENWSTKASKEQRDLAILGGSQPVLRKHYDAAEAAAQVIIQRFQKKGVDLTFKGDTKVQVLVQHRVEWESSDGVLCSGVIDRLELDHARGKAVIYDFKTTSDASTKALQRSVYNYGYNIQQQSYEEAVGVLYPAFLGRIKTVFLFAEKETPFVVRPLELAGSMRELGRRSWLEAKQTWAECMKTGVWPDYKDEQIEATAWMLADSLEAAMGGGDFEVVQTLGGINGTEV